MDPGIPMQRNPALGGLTCLRCGTAYGLDGPEPLTGCPRCRAEGYPASLVVRYDGGPWQPRPGARGMARYGERLPYLAYPSLGEGGTPLVDLPRLAATLGVARLWVKNEGQNPTGSHKDRLSPLVVARALELGYPAVIAASSGNQGVSLALYAAAAGLGCEIATTHTMYASWQDALEQAGARVVTFADPFDRWRYVARRVEEGACYPATNFIVPPVGSNPFGVDGYKTVAHEIVEATAGDEPPTVVVAPCSRGDLLWGLWRGFQEAREAGWLPELPRLVAAEPFPRLARVLAGADYRDQFPGRTRLVSIGGSTVTYQAVRAVEDSRGRAVAVTEGEAAEARQKLARAGVYAEGSSATTLAAALRLRDEGWLHAGDRVVLVVTSHGFKDGAEMARAPGR
ncbi:MAG: pyridoxal-5'-phosphate-dependent protein subunit beta [Bacillota bacterium]|nr:MAG: pyridoxal-5'-phosphate-dependent protein subunit beta [Bacillota bacterium]